MNPEPLQAPNSGQTALPVPRSHASGVRRRVVKRVLAGAGLLLLAACGQRGPLYMPDPNDPTKKRS